MKPQDLSLSFRDVLAAFVPGAVLLYTIIEISKESFGIRISNVVPGADILVFAALAYGLGSVVYAFGAGLDFLYDLLEPWVIRGRRRERFACFDILAADAKNRAVQAAHPHSNLSTLWSNKSFWVDQLRRTCPAASIELDRLEGTQKFFRTFSIVLLIITFHNGWTIYGTAAFAAFSVCFGFYVAKRAEWHYRLLKWAVISGI